MSNATKSLDMSKLYGFSGLNLQADQAIDFNDAAASARLGAKVGRIEVGGGAGGEITLEAAPELKKFA